MENPKNLTLILLFILVISADSSDGNKIHDLLRAHGLPAGLFPNSVSSFSFDPSTGLLEADLDHPCYAKYDGLAYFDRVVRGNLTYGELKGLVGLTQEELFVWLPVKGVLVNDPSSGVIMIDIGLAKKQLSLSLFEVPPDCTPDDGAAMISMVTQGLVGRKKRIQLQKRDK